MNLGDDVVNLLRELDFLHEIRQAMIKRFEQDVQVGFYQSEEGKPIIEFFLFESGYYTSVTLEQLKVWGILRTPYHIQKKLIEVNFSDFPIRPYNGYRGFVYHQ
jgi:hypothetical protein